MSAHPRRRAINGPPPTLSTFLPSTHYVEEDAVLAHNVSLRRSSTFNAPTTPPSEGIDPIIDFAQLPKRSQTCRKVLEDYVVAGEQRMAEFLGKIERNLAGLHTELPDSQATVRGKEVPVSKAALEAHVVDADPMELDRSPASMKVESPIMPAVHRVHVPRNRHTSDSGLGSSISGTNTALSYNGKHIKQG